MAMSVLSTFSCIFLLLKYHFNISKRVLLEKCWKSNSPNPTRLTDFHLNRKIAINFVLLKSSIVELILK